MYMKDFNQQRNESLDDYLARLKKYIEFDNLSTKDKMQIASAISFCLKCNNKYVTQTELYKYINKEITFDQIRDRINELSQAKTQGQYDKIIKDRVL